MSLVVPRHYKLEVPNKYRTRADYLSNIYFQSDILQDLNLNDRKIDNIRSAISEDAVTWNVLVGMLYESKSYHIPPFRIFGLESFNPILMLWNKEINRTKVSDGLQTSLIQVLKKVEANPASTSEIDAIIWSSQDQKLVYIEAKLNSRPGECPAAKKHQCRMYRETSKKRDNGCSYWGIGKGGNDFHNRFPINYVSKYFDYELPVESEEIKSDCSIYYQLMRNIIIGHELAKILSNKTMFTMVALVNEGHYDTSYYKDFESKLNREIGTEIQTISWQNIRDSLSNNSMVREYLRGHSEI